MYIQSYKTSVTASTGINLSYRAQIANGQIRPYHASSYRNTYEQAINTGDIKKYHEAINAGDILPYYKALQ